ncbi:hypothetical protein Moror_6679 [Moniliophthora roreri MCA 2997]|uniref:Uncharacterized protein n=1 Tax=Moniliophthora roreri (strain MCA 2997) TaxID=1381753 RepID=V2XSS7_MONRO|nr:hypothetical protein Moror_6679 [Moniliophthora roreri MCA 2997]
MSFGQSRFNYLLQTNYAPSPDELEEVRKLVQKPEDEVRLLNEQISQLQAKRDKLQSFIDSHRALLSPARRIPRDIIAEVFLQCLPTNRLPACSTGEAPLLLTAICRSWRQIALTTPRLWRAIHFVFPTLIGYTIDEEFRNLSLSRMEGLKLWLERARSVPLHVSFFLQHTPPIPRKVREELAIIYSQFSDILSCYSSQWKSLYFHRLPLNVLLPLQAKAGDAPLLHSLSLENNVIELTEIWEGQIGSNYPLFDITGASSLRVLQLRFERVDPLILPIHWEVLTELSLGLNLGFNPTTFPPMTFVNPIQIIHRLAYTCRSLRKCALHLSAPFEATFGNVDAPTQVWQHLTELDVQLGLYGSEGSDPSHHLAAWKGFFKTITTPALSHLAVSALDGAGIHGFDQLAEVPFVDLILRSGCRLSFLDLDMQVTDKALMDCLYCTPSLSTLHLVDMMQPIPYVTEDGMVTPEPNPMTLTQGLFEALTPTSDRSNGVVLCPLLETISLKQCRLIHSDAMVTFALARSGLLETAKLESFSATFQLENLTGNLRLPFEEAAKAQKIKENGVDVNWRSVYEERTLQRTMAHDSGMPSLIGEY